MRRDSEDQEVHLELSSAAVSSQYMADLLHRIEAGIQLAGIRILQPLALETNGVLETRIPRRVPRSGLWLLLRLPLRLLARRSGSRGRAAHVLGERSSLLFARHVEWDKGANDG